MATQLIIKGAIYTNGEELLRPHYSGEFFMVDCTEYKTKKQIKQKYSKETAKQFLTDGYYLTYEGEKYYECEFSPFNCGTESNFELLSDLSGLDFYDEETDF